MGRKRYSQQQIAKHSRKSCFFCGENDYNLLDAHRIIEGGKYCPTNIVVVCASCHRRIHSGKIVIDKKYSNTTGIPLVHYFEEGVEHWRTEQ